MSLTRKEKTNPHSKKIMAQIEPTVCINNLGLNLLWNCLNLALSLAGAKDNKEKPISTKSIKADQKYLRMQKKKIEKKRI